MTPDIKARSLATLQKARGYITAGWTQKSYGRDANGIGMGYATPGAVSFCMVGALYKAMPNEESRDIVVPCTQALHYGAGTSLLINFNDTPTRTKEDILAAYDRAIEALS